jgi:hypothetical protein
MPKEDFVLSADEQDQRSGLTPQASHLSPLSLTRRSRKIRERINETMSLACLESPKHPAFIIKIIFGGEFFIRWVTFV